jgi:hypothetical protein
MLNPPMDIKLMIKKDIARHEARAARIELGEESVRVAQANLKYAREALARLEGRHGA